MRCLEGHIDRTSSFAQSCIDRYELVAGRVLSESMDDSITLFSIAAFYALAVIGVFSGLVWAEVLDGREDASPAGH
jgi:hypothetical protein